MALDSEFDEVCYATFYIDGNNLLSLIEHDKFKYISREVSKHGGKLIQNFKDKILKIFLTHKMGMGSDNFSIKK